MKILAIVGDSGTGKTRFITHVIPELRKRGLSVAVIKHCAHGFDLVGQDKDSSKLIKAGASGVALVSPGQWAVLKRNAQDMDFSILAQESFRTADFVLVEGGRKDKSLRKIEVLRSGVSEEVQSSPQELAAVIADFYVSCQVPVFHPDQFEKIADWLAGGF